MKNTYKDDVNISIDLAGMEEEIIGFITQPDDDNNDHLNFYRDRLNSLKGEIFESEFYYDYSKPDILELFIYYKQVFFLKDLFDLLVSNGKRLFDYLKVAEPEFNYGQHELYDFSESILLNILDSPSLWKLGRRPVIIQFKKLIRYTESKYARKSTFYLSTNSIDAFARGYFLPSSDGLQFKNEKLDFPIKWGVHHFNYGFQHEILEFNVHNINLLRLPYITLPYQYNYSPEEMIELVDKLCTIISLFCHKEVSLFYAHIDYEIKKENRTYRTILYHDDSKEYIDENEYNIWFDDYFLLENLVDAVDQKKLDVCYPLMKEIVRRIIKSLRVDEISEFMLLYNVIEKIRNHFIKISESMGEKTFIDEQFNFTVNEEEALAIINNKLNEISEIIEESDKQAFQRKIVGTADHLKLKVMKDQWYKFFDYIKIETSLYGVDLKKLIKTRSRIFHGSAKGTSGIVEYNAAMRKIIKDLIIKLIFKDTIVEEKGLI